MLRGSHSDLREKLFVRLQFEFGDGAVIKFVPDGFNVDRNCCLLQRFVVEQENMLYDLWSRG
jgi:hypothetical protein